MRISDWSSDVCSSDLAVEPGEGGIGIARHPAREAAMEDQRLADEQQQGEDRPHAHHRVHPPEIEAAEAAPQIELRHHVEPARPDEENGGARLPDEAKIGRASCRESVCKYG